MYELIRFGVVWCLGNIDFGVTSSVARELALETRKRSTSLSERHCIEDFPQLNE